MAGRYYPHFVCIILIRCPALLLRRAVSFVYHLVSLSLMVHCTVDTLPVKSMTHERISKAIQFISVSAFHQLVVGYGITGASRAYSILDQPEKRTKTVSKLME